MLKKNDFHQLLTNRQFLLIWLGQLGNLISAATLLFVLIGHIFALSESTIAVGFFFFLYYLPTLILGPFIGVFIDNFSKKKIFIYSSFSQAVIVLFFSGFKGQVWPLYPTVLLYSLCDEFYNPSVLVSLPAVVKKSLLPAANTIFFFTLQGSLIIGSFLGGILLKVLTNQNWIFVILSGLLLSVGLISLSLASKPLRGSRQIKFDLSDPLDLSQTFDLPGFYQQLKEGYLFIKNEPLVLFPILLLAGLQTIGGMAFILFPSMAQMLEIAFADSALMIILPAILGAIIGGLLAQKRLKKIRKNVLVTGGLTGLGAGMMTVVVFSLFMRRPILAAIPFIFLLGLSYVSIMIPLQTLLQEKTPIKVRGRVFAALSTIVTLAAALPMLITTTLVDLFGIQFVLLIFGIGLVALAQIAKKRWVSILLANHNENR